MDGTGVGLAELSIGDSELAIVAGLQRMFGKDAMTKGALAFAHAAAVDPTFVRGLVELANTAMSQRINIKLDLALTALRAAAPTAAARNPEVLLWRGRVERESGRHRFGDRRASADTSKSGQDRALGLLELARARFIKGELGGAEDYYRGAALDDSAAVEGYRADLAYIAADSTLAAFDSVHGAVRAAFLHRFWSVRDRGALRRDNERLREHYRRINYARHNFMLVSLNRHYDIVERYKSNSKDFDDRGIIFIRHGDPSDRATLTIPGIELNETWRYARTDGDLIFHFVAREDVQDYKLVESLYDILGFSNALTARGGFDSTENAELVTRLLESRERINPLSMPGCRPPAGRRPSPSAPRNAPSASGASRRARHPTVTG